jgi:high-affinity nickel-transport protein
MMHLVGRSWHMYPLGLLFGLGFDTATEVGILGIAAIEASKGLPIVSILVFPLLFTAGMSLIDTSDGILMLGAYGWAFVNPIRKLYYNMNVTLVSVLVAVLVGTIELAGVLSDRLKVSGAAGAFFECLGENSSLIGFAIIGILLATWCVSLLLYKVRRYDELPVETLEGTA